MLNIFNSEDKYRITTEVELNEIVSLFHDKFNIDENAFNSKWVISSSPYVGIFSLPNRFLLKRSSLLPTNIVKNVITFDIIEGDATVIDISIKNIFPKILVMIFMVYLIFVSTYILINDFNFLKVGITSTVLIIIFSLLGLVVEYYNRWQIRYFEKFLSQSETNKAT